MSMERPSGQGYALLPQSISNTDTEEEDERLALPSSDAPENDRVHDVESAQGNLWCYTMDDGRRKFEKRSPLPSSDAREDDQVHDVESAQGNLLCYTMDDVRKFEKHTEDSTIIGGGYRYCGTDVPIIVPDLENQVDFWKRQEATMRRRCCTVLSILFCFFAFYTFLYVLPCSNTKICPPVVQKQPVITLDKTLEGVEIHGPITIIHGSPYSLIFLLRGQFYGVNSTDASTSREIPTDGGGVLSMQGNTGALLWWVRLKQLLVGIDCSTFDTDGSGSPDCIVIGQDLMVSIDPISGTIHWTERESLDARLPLRVHDIDSDGIDDMVAVKDLAMSPWNAIVLISGKSGKILKGLFATDCEPYGENFVRLIGFDSKDTVFYSCEGSSTKQTVNRTLLLSSLVEAEFSDWPTSKNTSTPDPTAVTRYPTSREEKIENYAMILTPFYRLNVQNFGSCPGENCHVNVNVTLQKSEHDNGRVIWNHSSNNSYAMRPAVYAVNKTGYVTGFAIKFWQWNDDKDKSGDDTEKIFERHVTERVLMVFVNYTNVHVIDASQSEIVQLCKNDECQPSLSMQTRSIAIADLGDDGTWELINYQSSYNTEKPRILTSRVQIVKLDTVLSQLTQTVSN